MVKKVDKEEIFMDDGIDNLYVFDEKVTDFTEITKEAAPAAYLVALFSLAFFAVVLYVLALIGAFPWIIL